MDNFQEYNSPKWNTDWENFLEHQALENKFTRCQKSAFITRLKRDNWEAKIDDVWEQSIIQSRDAFVSHMTKVYDAYEDECPELGQGAGNFPILKDYLRNIFPTKIHPDNRRDQYHEILESGALIRIKAPSKMGKTQLLNNMLTFANQQEYQTVPINFLQIECNKFKSLDLFLRWFCIAISDALKFEIDLDQYWHQDRGSKQNCTRFLEYVLQNHPQPLVLGLDNVDRLLEYPDISQDFYYLLRYWYEEANNNELLEKLRLIVVYSTEDFGNLNINQSPFNVGEVIEPKIFTRQQIEELAQQYGLDLSDSKIEQLISLLDGHPYLVDLMMSHLANNSEISLAILLKQAPTDIGIYSSFLQQLLNKLRNNEQLAQAFLKIIQSETEIKIDIMIARQLYWMGLIKWSDSGNTVMPLCKLYRLYFQDRL